VRHYIYNAGPFFNAAQVAAMERLEKLEGDNNLDFFAPRLSPESDLIRQGDRSAETFQKTFERDVEEIGKATIMVAMLDWLMPPEEEVRILRHEGVPGKPGYHQQLSAPLNVPDSGTVFELGLAFAAGLPVIGVRFDCERPLNLMLSESCFMLCQHWPQLADVLEMLSGWTGGRI